MDTKRFCCNTVLTVILSFLASSVDPLEAQALDFAALLTPINTLISSAAFTTALTTAGNILNSAVGTAASLALLVPIGIGAGLAVKGAIIAAPLVLGPLNESRGRRTRNRNRTRSRKKRYLGSPSQVTDVSLSRPIDEFEEMRCFMMLMCDFGSNPSHITIMDPISKGLSSTISVKPFKIDQQTVFRGYEAFVIGHQSPDGTECQKLFPCGLANQYFAQYLKWVTKLNTFV